MNAEVFSWTVDEQGNKIPVEQPKQDVAGEAPVKQEAANEEQRPL